MQLVVGHGYGKFLAGLQPKPMALNEMRNMKEPNYSRLREVVRDPRLYGDPLLRKLCEGAETVGISSNSYHMVHEGFWDLYCKKPATTDLTAKKLDGWVNFVNLKLPVSDPPADPVEEAEGVEPVPVEEAEPAIPVKAVARVRIPFKRPEPVDGEEEEEGEEKKEEDEKSNKKKVEDKKEEPLEEIDYEDKVEAIPTQGENYTIYVVHQLAQRLLRESICKEFKEFLPELAH